MKLLLTTNYNIVKNLQLFIPTGNLATHKSTTIKLVWPFTSNAGRENGKKKVYKWKPMLTRPLERPKNRWEMT